MSGAGRGVNEGEGFGAVGAAKADKATLPAGTDGSVVGALRAMAGGPLAEAATPAGAAAVAAFMGETAGGACVGTFLPAYVYGRVDAAATGAGHSEGGTAKVCKAVVETGQTAAGCNVVPLLVVGKLTCAPPAAVGGEADEVADVG